MVEKRTSVGQVLFAVGRAAESLIGELLKQMGTSEVGADQLRQYVKSALDSESNWNARKFWQPLDDSEKQEALTRAIPDGVYPEFWQDTCDEES